MLKDSTGQLGREMWGHTGQETIPENYPIGSGPCQGLFLFPIFDLLADPLLSPPPAPTFISGALENELINKHCFSMLACVRELSEVTHSSFLPPLAPLTLQVRHWAERRGRDKSGLFVIHTVPALI